MTYQLAPGLSFARWILTMSRDASQPDVGAIEKATFATELSDIGVGRDDGDFSAVAR